MTYIILWACFIHNYRPLLPSYNSMHIGLNVYNMFPFSYFIYGVQCRGVDNYFDVEGVAEHVAMLTLVVMTLCVLIDIQDAYS